jgi:coatomer subunit beta'
MQKINSFRAAVGGPISLAVHPTQPYVMSWRRIADLFSDQEMKLWDWDKGWECTRIFQTGGRDVDHVAFDPNETSRFVSTDSFGGGVTVCMGSSSFNSPLKKQQHFYVARKFSYAFYHVQIWSLDYPKSEYELPNETFNVSVTTSVEFFTRYDRQYLVIVVKEAHVCIFHHETHYLLLIIYIK